MYFFPSLKSNLIHLLLSHFISHSFCTIPYLLQNPNLTNISVRCPSCYLAPCQSSQHIPSCIQYLYILIHSSSTKLYNFVLSLPSRPTLYLTTYSSLNLSYCLVLPQPIFAVLPTPFLPVQHIISYSIPFSPFS